MVFKFLILLFLVPASFASIPRKSIEAYLGQHYENSVKIELERLFPNNKFLVRSRVLLDSEKFKDSNDQESFRLPLGYATFELNEDNGGKEELKHPVYYRQHIKAIDIDIQFSEALNAETNTWLKDQIRSLFKLEELGVYTVSIGEIPPLVSAGKSYSSNTSLLGSIFPFMEQITGTESAALILSLFFLGIFLSIGIFLFKGSTGLSKTLSQSLEKMGDRNVSMPVQPPPPPKERLSLPVVHGPPVTSVKDWDNFETDEIVAYAYDCLGHPLYESAAIVLSHKILPLKKASELKASLPPFFYDKDGPGKSLAPESEIIELFDKHKADYALMYNKPLSSGLIKMPVEKVMELVELLSKGGHFLNIAVLLSRLTPIKKQVVLEKISFKTKVKLAQATSQQTNTFQLAKIEEELLQATKNLTSESSTPFYGSEFLKALGQELLQPKSFAEDEIIFTELKLGILLALENFTKAEWNSLSPNKVALAFFGYSTAIQNKVRSQFEDKQGEWLKNFMNKYAHQNLSFQHPEVISARNEILSLLQDKSTPKASKLKLVS